MTIHREGYPTLLLTLVVLTVLNVALHYFLPAQELLHNIVLLISLVLFLIVLQFFRNPHVEIQVQAGKVIAPADGKVVVIEETVENEYFKDKRKQVSIFMSPFNVHVNRNPISGVVKYFRYHPGLYLVAWHPKASTDNERTTIVVQNDKGTEVLFRQIAGALARRICWYVEEGQRVMQGSEFGFIKFGSRVDIFLPLDAKITVELNQKTTAGKTVIAEIG
ncbi:phosphatidylserine decarboxylase family protein [Rhodoflexus caldus]|uniref:phosphatidylserine decarboxylase family protein n=1 Tax=Rhodoflexus caldus TaxID=2891236 RepID=UPI00202AC216|nr:phosphatidylserine decarboxylase family protein [Rhodoflexus caldus]